MNRIIATVRGIQVYQDDDQPLKITWTSGAAVDADGANGQAGKAFAYRYPTDDGLDRLIDAGYPNASWTNVLINDGSGHPLTDGSGNAYSSTTYAWPHRPIATRFVDAASVPYCVVNPFVRRNSVGIVIGCRAVIKYNGKQVEAVVADESGGNDIGEIAIVAAEMLGIPSSPRTGGVDSGVTFEVYPNQPAIINGETYLLQRARILS